MGEERAHTTANGPAQDQAAVARQLRCPSGVEAVAVGEEMNSLNAVMNRVALEELDPAPTDRVLEIGFGGGALLDELLARGSSVVGVDLSPVMVGEARRRLGSGAKICCGSVEALPCREGAFTQVCSVNTIYFWNDLHHAFLECRRVLRPEGHLVVCFNARHELEKDSWHRFGFILYSEAEVLASLRSAGFERLEVRSERDPEQGEFFCVRASPRSGLV